MFWEGTVLTDSGAGGVAPSAISVPAVGTRMQEKVAGGEEIIREKKEVRRGQGPRQSWG